MKRYFGLGLVALALGACGTGNTGDAGTDAHHDAVADHDATDGNVADHNAPDGASPDAQRPDEGVPDAATDGATTDGAQPDTGEPDATTTDAGEPDATTTTDAGEPDASGTDAIVVDAGEPDTGAPDAIVMDAADPPDASTMDAGATDVVTVDVAPDVPRGTSPLFGACNVDNDCANPVGGCVTDFPGGLCSVTCSSDATCGANGICYVQPGATVGLCLPSCTLGGHQCASTAACFSLSATDATRRACFPSCATPPPAGGAACDTGLTCDAYVGTCSATASTGFDDGHACTANSDCRGGDCIQPTNAGQPTGWLGGYCVSFARGLDVATSYGSGLPLPQSNCPAGDVALPYETGSGLGDSFACFQSCTTSAGCRAGYTCVRDLGGGLTSSNGYCAPVDCSVAGMTCPSGTTCRTVGAGTTAQHVCG